MPHPLVIGRHTRAIADAVTDAVRRFRMGLSTYLDIEVAFRHGKSDISSRAVPAFILGTLADLQPDVMLLSYAAALSNDFSRDVKQILHSNEYQTLFPGVLPALGRDNVESWSVDGSHGRNTFTGLGGSFVGKGAGVLIVDDYFAGKDEARSEKIRKSRWEGFTDALTRLAPVHIVMLVATSWHTDDVRARLKKAEKTQEGFPTFQHLSFPAKVTTGTGWQGEYLFPERYSKAWYETMYASQGHWASALLDCEPVTEGGNRFKIENVIIHRDRSGWPAGRETRGWDLASSTKQRDKDDPDWTWGVRGLVKTERITVDGQTAKRHHVWISDLVACQAEAPERDRLIRKTAIADGMGVLQAVEAFGGYKDAYTSLKAVLGGVSTVRKSHLSGDKSAKLADLEPSFDGGIVHVLDGPNVRPWLKQFSEFPDGAHDDACDATAVMFHENTRSGCSLLI
jgi:predicted phage terminase large subunit-like protein